MKTVITSQSAPAAIGPYSHGTEYNGLIFSSGQLPVDAVTGKVAEGGITEQSVQSLKNLVSVLEAAEAAQRLFLKQLVTLQIYLILQHLMLCTQMFLKPTARHAAVSQ